MALLLRGVKDRPKAKAYAVLRSALSEELGRHGGTLLTKSEFLAAREAARAVNSYRENIAVFGTIYLMAVVAIIQTAITNADNRRRESHLYRSLGVGRRGILGILGVEALVLAISNHDPERHRPGQTDSLDAATDRNGVHSGRCRDDSGFTGRRRSRPAATGTRDSNLDTVATS